MLLLFNPLTGRKSTQKKEKKICFHRGDVCTEQKWSRKLPGSLWKSNSLYFPALAITVFLQETERERVGEREGILMWLLTLKKLSFCSKGAGLLFSEVKIMPLWQRKRINTDCTCFHVRTALQQHNVNWQMMDLNMTYFEKGSAVRSLQLIAFPFKWMQLKEIAYQYK